MQKYAKVCKSLFKRRKRSKYFSAIPNLLCIVSVDLNFNFFFSLKPDNRQQMAPEVFNRFADDTASKVPVKQISLPDLSIPLQLGRREPFSLFIPKHRKIAARLIDIFLGSFQLYSIIFNYWIKLFYRLILFTLYLIIYNYQIIFVCKFNVNVSSED